MRGLQVTLGCCVRWLFWVSEVTGKPVARPGDREKVVPELFGNARQLWIFELLIAGATGRRRVFLAGVTELYSRRWAPVADGGCQFLQLGIDAVCQRATLACAVEVLTGSHQKSHSRQESGQSHREQVISITVPLFKSPVPQARPAGVRRVWARIGVALGVLLASGCQRSDEPPLPERNPRRIARAPAESSAEAKDAGDSWLRRQLDELRDKTLKWTPRDEPLQKLVFAGDRLFAVLGNEIIVVDASGKEDPMRYPIDGSHQLAPLGDEFVLAVGLKSTLRLRPGAKNPDSLNKVLLLPHSQLFGSASDAAHFDVLDVVAGQWTAYSFADQKGVSSLWLPDNSFDLPELKLAHCAQLLDGSYACFAGVRLWHLYTRSRPKQLGQCGVGSPVWLVLGAARADQVWVVRTDGHAEKWWFGPPLKKLVTFDLPWTPLDVSIGSDTIAEIRILQDRAQPKQIDLVLTDTEGHTRFEQSLQPHFEADTNNVEQELREAEVVAHKKKPWVAVRTSQELRLLSTATGETILELR